MSSSIKWQKTWSSVILEAYCRLVDGHKCNIEVQKSNDENHIRRVRYNASCITANITNPGTNFKDAPDIIMIFISKFNIFKGKKTIYHIERVVKENGVVNDNGVQEIYVNTKIDDGSSIAAKTSVRKRYFKEDKGGRREMCEAVERQVREEAMEAAKILFENGVDFDIVKISLKLPEDVVREIYEEVKGR